MDVDAAADPQRSLVDIREGTTNNQLPSQGQGPHHVTGPTPSAESPMSVSHPPTPSPAPRMTGTPTEPASGDGLTPALIAAQLAQPPVQALVRASPFLRTIFANGYSQHALAAVLARLQASSSSSSSAAPSPNALPSEEDLEVQRIHAFLKAVIPASILRRHNAPTQNQTNGINGSNDASNPNHSNTTSHPASAPAPTSVPAPPPVVFSAEQLLRLKHQIAAFRLLSRGMPVPEALKRAIYDPTQVLRSQRQPSPASGSASDLAPPEMDQAMASAAYDVHLATVAAAKANPVYPYNSYVHPFTHLRAPSPVDGAHIPLAAKQQRLLVPSLLPTGIDPYLLAEERNRLIDVRIQQRIRELQTLPATLPDRKPSGLLLSSTQSHAVSSSKIRALIELKSLQLLGRQKTLRREVIAGLAGLSSLTTDRTQYRRYKKQTMRDVREIEAAERAQRSARENTSKLKHTGYVNTILEHGRLMVSAGQAAVAKHQRLGRAIQRLHVEAKAEEAKRIERISKERLRALKNDDEEAYMKLLDTAKDTRITHLLKQTDTYLDSLAQAVMAQQNDPLYANDVAVAQDPEDGPANEATFGARRMDEPEEDNTKLDYYAISHRIQEKVTSQPSILVGGKLKEYQLKGLQWMISLYNNKLNGILADEMGLGKTIQTISLVTYLIERKRIPGPFLIIVPLSTLPNWTMEFDKWAPSVTAVSYKGTPLQRKAAQAQIKAGAFQVLMTTYEYIIKDRLLLSKIKWMHMIIDEGHRMKNSQSKLAQTLSQHYSTRHRLILTGTPLQNNLPELWALLNFVLPKVFNSIKSFDEWFNAPFAGTGSQDKIEINEEESLLVIRRLHKVLRPFLLRRLKKDVESELPDKKEEVISCKMSALQSRLYAQMFKYKCIAGEDVDAKGNAKPVAGLNNVLMQLRKICNHPFIFQTVEHSLNPSQQSNDLLYRTCGKFELLDRILPKLRATGHRVLMFFQMTQIMTIMEDFLAWRGIRYMRLDGTTKQDDRGQLLKAFNAPDSEYFIFLLSTRAGGLGLNLQTADTVILYDSDWNPHADLQAQDRAHRIGQKKEVRILRLVHMNTVEEQILSIAKGKLDMDSKIIQAGKFDNQTNESDRDAFLRAILERSGGAQDADQGEDGDEMEDDELNDLIARDSAELEVFQRIDKERIAADKRAWQLKGHSGETPSRLIQTSELPAHYRSDNVFNVAEDEEEDEGRGQRSRGQRVRYDEGLTEDQWLKALEDDNIDLDQAIEKAHQRRDRRRANKLLKDAGMDVSMGMTPELDEPPTSDSEMSLPQSSAKKRGRGPKARLSSLELKRKWEPTDEASSVVDVHVDEPSVKKQRMQTPKSKVSKYKAFFQEVYALVDNALSSDGRNQSDIFQVLPSKAIYPTYYMLITRPISMAQIKKKIDKNTYPTTESYLADWELMFNNARTFNTEGSMVYEDANDLERIVRDAFERHTGTATSEAEVEAEAEASDSTSVIKSKAPAGIKLRLNLGRGRMTNTANGVGPSSDQPSSVVAEQQPAKEDRPDEKDESGSRSDSPMTEDG